MQRGTCPHCGKPVWIDRRYKGPHRCNACRGHHDRHWTAERISERIQHWANTHGGVPPSYARFVAQPGNPNAGSIYQRPTSPFRTWNDAIRAAGYTPIEPGQNRISYPDDQDGRRKTELAKPFGHTDTETSIVIPTKHHPPPSDHARYTPPTTDKAT